MREVLTALKVKHQKPDPRRRLELPDAALPGLYLIVQPNGRSRVRCATAPAASRKS